MFESVSDAPPPGLVRRFAAGAWHVPAGLWFLLMRPRLWPRAALPALVVVLGMALGFMAGLVLTPQVEAAVIPASWPPWLSIPAWVAVLFWTPLSGLVLGLAVALLLAAPLLEWLQRRVEVLESGHSPDAGRGLLWDVLQSLRGAAFFALAAPLVLLLGLIPLVGPPLGALWAAHNLVFQQTDSPLSRRGRDFRGRRRWHAEWRPETLGFGFAGLVTLLVPIANLAVAPALAIGAARLVMELEALSEPDPVSPGAAERGPGDAGPPPPAGEPQPAVEPGAAATREPAP